MRLTIYTPANTKPRLALNRYGAKVIGLALVARGRCYSWTWRKA